MTACGIRTRFWVDLCLECVRRDHTPERSLGDQRGPFLTARALGLALGALRDIKAAQAGISGLLSVQVPPVLLPMLSSAEMVDLAAAAACHEVLRLRYPNQSPMLEPAWINWLEQHEISIAGTSLEMAARAYGRDVHLLGKDDMVHALPGYVPNADDYRHRAPAQEPAQGYAGYRWGDADPLAAERVSPFPPPPGRINAQTVLPTEHFRNDFRKVAAKGDINQAPGDPDRRSLNEEIIGIAWGYDGSNQIGTPPRLYLQVVLSILDSIEERHQGKLSDDEELTITAAAAVAMADAGIDAWYYKYNDDHMMWRPAVGIPRAVTGNGIADPDWRPLGRPDTNGSGLGLTPDFPAYPSGHATFGAAAFQLLRLYLAEKQVSHFDAKGVDSVRFTFVSDEYNGRNVDPRTRLPRDVITLDCPSLWKAITDNSVSRVYLGVHWQFDGITKRNAADTGDEFGIPDSPDELGRTGGVWLGGQIANQIARRIGITEATILDSRMS